MHSFIKVKLPHSRDHCTVALCGKVVNNSETSDRFECMRCLAAFDKVAVSLGYHKVYRYTDKQADVEQIKLLRHYDRSGV